MYLHELCRIILKTEMDEIRQTVQRDPERTQLFLPVPPVGTNDQFYIIFVNRGIFITDSPDVFVFIQIQADLLLIGKRDLGIGND